MPTSKIVTGWAAQVPEDFKFTLKAPKRITQDKRLRAAEVGDTLQTFVSVAGELGPQLAALLFQLPPNFKKDLVLLNEFLSLLPPKTTAAFEFRHASWLDDEVYAALKARNIALCIADSEARQTPAITTADYAYLRLRDEGYGDAEIARWTAISMASTSQSSTAPGPTSASISATTSPAKAAWSPLLWPPLARGPRASAGVPRITARWSRSAPGRGCGSAGTRRSAAGFARRRPQE